MKECIEISNEPTQESVLLQRRAYSEQGFTCESVHNDDNSDKSRILNERMAQLRKEKVEFRTISLPREGKEFWVKKENTKPAFLGGELNLDVKKILDK